jgi:hypothetical protein
MTLFAADRSTQRTLVIAWIVLALLVLPFLGTLHCQAMHDADGHAATSTAAEACCVFFCFTALISMTFIPLNWLTMGRAASTLRPVRLTNHLTRWVPPPRPIDPLA